VSLVAYNVVDSPADVKSVRDASNPLVFLLEMIVPLLNADSVPSKDVELESNDMVDSPADVNSDDNVSDVDWPDIVISIAFDVINVVDSV